MRAQRGIKPRVMELRTLIHRVKGARVNGIRYLDKISQDIAKNEFFGAIETPVAPPVNSDMCVFVARYLVAPKGSVRGGRGVCADRKFCAVASSISSESTCSGLATWSVTFASSPSDLMPHSILVVW